MVPLEPRMIVVASLANPSADTGFKLASTLSARPSAKRRIVPVELKVLLCKFNESRWSRKIRNITVQTVLQGYVDVEKRHVPDRSTC